jgi:RNA polymerase-binding transcription factor
MDWRGASPEFYRLAPRGAIPTATKMPAVAAADHQDVRAKLLAERARVLGEIAYNEDEVEALQEQSGDERQDEQMGGGASFTLDREIDRALDDNAEHILHSIDEALKRVDDGTYGICAHCGRPISEGRLQARPYAALCIDCV